MAQKNRRIRRLGGLALALLLLAAPVRAQSADEVLGTAATRYTGIEDPDSRSTETSVGNALADAARHAADGDWCIIPGGLICNNIIAGDVTWRALTLVLPEDAFLAEANVTIAQLRELIEQCVAHVVLDDTQTIDYVASRFDGYPQISGFTLRYDVSRPVGERVVYIKNADDVALDLEDDSTTIRLISTAGLLGGEYGTDALDYTLLTPTLREAFAQFIRAGGLTGEERGRVKVAGSSDNTLLGDFPIELAALTLIFLVLAFRVFYHPKLSFANGFKMPPKGERFDDLALPAEEEDTKEENP